MPKETNPTDTSFEGKNRKLAYENEFRSMLRENPGIIKAAINLTDKALEEYDPEEIQFENEDEKIKFDKRSGRWLMKRSNSPMTRGRGTILAEGKPLKDDKSGLEVSVLGRSNREMPIRRGTRFDKSDYFKLALNGQVFFVKRSTVTNNPGFVEFRNTISAKEALKELDFVKVIEAKLGYQDSNESWFVSKWEDLESAGFNTYPVIEFGNINDYGHKVKDGLGILSREYKDVEDKIDLIRMNLRKTLLDKDLSANLFYNRQTNTFILLDVTGAFPENAVGNPIKNTKRD